MLNDVKRLIRSYPSRAISLSQHDSLQQIESRLDLLQDNQEASSNAKATAEIQDALNAVKSLPEVSAVLNKLSAQVTQLSIGMLFSLMLCNLRSNCTYFLSYYFKYERPRHRKSIGIDPYPSISRSAPKSAIPAHGGSWSVDP